MKIGMYSSDEIYDELANGFLHHSMVDAMYFEIEKLREENQRLKKQKDDVINYIKNRFDSEKGIWIVDCYEMLEMLGEIDD